MTEENRDRLFSIAATSDCCCHRIYGRRNDFVAKIRFFSSCAINHTRSRITFVTIRSFLRGGILTQLLREFEVKESQIPARPVTLARMSERMSDIAPDLKFRFRG